MLLLLFHLIVQFTITKLVEAGFFPNVLWNITHTHEIGNFSGILLKIGKNARL